MSQSSSCNFWKRWWYKNLTKMRTASVKWFCSNKTFQKRSTRGTVAKPIESGNAEIQINRGSTLHWLQSNCFCTKTRLYDTGGLVWVQRGDFSLRQFTFNNRWFKLFIYSPLLPSSLLSYVCLVWFPKSEKGGQLGGNGKKTRESFILDGGMKTTGVIQFSYATRSGATHSKLLQVMCCRIVTIFQTCCEFASSSLIISGSRCLLRQWSYNERVWLQQGAAEI